MLYNNYFELFGISVRNRQPVRRPVPQRTQTRLHVHGHFVDSLFPRPWTDVAIFGIALVALDRSGFEEDRRHPVGEFEGSLGGTSD